MTISMIIHVSTSVLTAGLVITSLNTFCIICNSNYFGTKFLRTQRELWDQIRLYKPKNVMYMSYCLKFITYQLWLIQTLCLQPTDIFSFYTQDCVSYIFKRGTKDTKGPAKLINLKQTDNAMAKNEKYKHTNNSLHDTT